MTIRNSTAIELILCSSILLGSALYALIKARRRTNIAVVDWAIWMTALYFGGGPWIAFYHGGWTLPYETPSVLVQAYFSVWLFLLGLLIAERLHPGSQWKEPRKQPGDRPTIKNLAAVLDHGASASPVAVLLLVGVAWAVRLYYYFGYGILVSGSGTALRISRVPYWLTVIGSMSRLIGIGGVTWSATVTWQSRSIRAIPLVILATEAVFAFLQGRRPMLDLTIILMVAFLASRSALRFRHVAVGIAAFYILSAWLFPAFFAFRTTYQEMGRQSSIQEAIERTSTRSPTGEGYRRNMATRPLIIRWNCDILQGQSFRDPMWGQVFVNGLAWSVPAFVYPEKRHLTSTEALVSRHYGLPDIDASGNWPALGAADFGVLGGLAMGLLLGFALCFMEMVAVGTRTWFPFVSLCNIGAILTVAFAVEADAVTLWSSLRDIAILCLVALVLKAAHAPIRHRMSLNLRGRVQAPAQG